METPANALSRVIVLIDMDCFYCQVEEKLDESLKGKPIAVVQYNMWKGGGIIAVNYAARDRGVSRHMRGEEAKEKCPEIELVVVPHIRGKADLTKYRDAGKLVANVLQTFTSLLERASVDEAYLDITESVEKELANATGPIARDAMPNTFVVGRDDVGDFLGELYHSEVNDASNLKLAMGAVITERIRAAVYEETGYRCSAGIAHNKILAKLSCGLNKPNKQTILPHAGVEGLFRDLPVKKIRTLGGKFGANLTEELGVKNMLDLRKFTEKELQAKYDDKTGTWLYNIARGFDYDPVTLRLISKSIGCCKKFPGKTALCDTASIQHWLGELAAEMVERLEKDAEENSRRACQLVVSFSYEVNKRDLSGTRCHHLSSYDAKRLAGDAFEVVRKNCRRSDGTFCIKFLGLSAGKFEESRTNIAAMIQQMKPAEGTSKEKPPEKPLEKSLEKSPPVAKKSDEKPLEAKPKRDSIEFFFQPVNPDTDSSDSAASQPEEEPEPADTEIQQIMTGEEASCSSNLHGDDLERSKANSFFLRHFEREDAKAKQQEKQQEKRPVPKSEPKAPAKKGAKKQKKAAGKGGIEAFFSSQQPAERDGFYYCAECKKHIPEPDVLDHSDFHFAQKLQREINMGSSD